MSQEKKVPPVPKTLIVFCEVPEHLSFYLVQQDHPIVETARIMSGLYVNGDKMTKKQERAAEQLHTWMVTKEGQACKRKAPIKARIREVIETGFIM